MLDVGYYFDQPEAGEGCWYSSEKRESASIKLSSVQWSTY